MPHTLTDAVTYKIVRGALVEEIHQVFKPWVHQVIRLYKEYDYIEFDWIIGPIPATNWFYDQGQEIITRYDTDFITNATFFTDANGRETMRRVRHFRPTWDLQTTEEVSSNYYPVTTWMFLRDYEKDLQLTVLTDRAQGGSSMIDGSLELMLHRRLLYDDGFGVEEPLNEPGYDGEGLIVRGRHRVLVNSIKESIRQMKSMSKTLTWKPLATFRKRTSFPSFGNRGYFYHIARSADRTKFVGINRLLPKNIHLLTLEPWDDDRVLLR